MASPAVSFTDIGAAIEEAHWLATYHVRTYYLYQRGHLIFATRDKPKGMRVMYSTGRRR